MKPEKIEDTSGDCFVVGVFETSVGRYVNVENEDGADEMLYTPEQSRRLRKALKRAEREIKARA